MTQIAGENSVPLGIPLLRVRLSDDERELLYASTWEGNDEALGSLPCNPCAV